MKKIDLYLSFLQIPIDVLMILAAVVAAYFIRAKFEIPPIIYLPPIFEYLKYALFILPVWLLIFALNGLYTIKETPRGFLDEILKIFMAVSVCLMFVLIIIFSFRTYFFSRLIILYTFFLMIIFVSLGRYLLHLLRRWLYKFNIGVKKIILFGKNEFSDLFLKQISQNKKLGFKVIAHVFDFSSLEKFIKHSKPDEIIQTDPNTSFSEILKLINFCEEKRIGFRYIPNLFEMKTSHVSLSTLFGLPLIRLRRTPLEEWGKLIKRIFDLLISFFALILLSPIFLIVAWLIKADSRGPVFFKHKRIGAEGKEFYLYKFRSMIEKAPELYPKLAKVKITKSLFYPKIEDDPRITKFGRFLRKTCLDELPQFFNVLKGDISLVGPRPLVPKEFERVKNSEKRYRWVSYVKPGMTGLWQISGRSFLKDKERINLDLYYVENWSLFLDFYILFKTLVTLQRGAG